MPENFNPIEHTANGYNCIADAWDQTRRQPWAEVNSYIEKYLKDGQKIIDIGCGNGRAIFMLEKYSDLEYLGIDNSEKLIEKAKTNFPTFSFEHFDGLDFSKYKKDYYDVALSVAVVHHVPEENITKWLRDICSTVKTGGIIFITSWDVLNGKSKEYLDTDNKGLLPFMHYKDIRFVKSYTKEELEKYLIGCNLEILESGYVSRESGERNIFIVCQKR